MDNCEAIKLFPSFLSVFDLYINENDDYVGFLLDGYDVSIYDKDYNLVGRVFMDNGDLNAQIMLKNSTISIIGKADGDKSYKYMYEIKNTKLYKKINGYYKINYGEKFDDYTIDTTGNIFTAGHRNYAFKFSTLKNKFLVIDYRECDSTFYRKNELYHNTNDHTTIIKADKGDLEYEIISVEEGKNLVGYTQVPLVLNATMDEIIFRKILDDIDPSYVELINKVESKTDYFVPKMFKKLACRGLKNFNKSQLSAILDIDFSEDYCKTKVFTGKKSSN